MAERILSGFLNGLTNGRAAAAPRWLKALFTVAWTLGMVFWPMAGCQNDPPAPPGFERVQPGDRTYPLALAPNALLTMNSVMTGAFFRSSTAFWRSACWWVRNASRSWASA